MVDYVHSNLFQQSSVDKQLIIETDDKTVKITNNELHQQKFELEESLCSENQLKFGSCEASSIKFTVSNIFTSLKDKWINASMVLDNHTDDPFQIGRYKVYSDVPSGDKSYREVTAYDALYDIINTNMAAWYNALTFPLTLKEFRDSFFAYLEVEQEEVELINDSMSIEKTIDTDELSGKDILSAICELNGCFGHIGRDGKFKFIILVQKAEGLFPNNTLYPEDGLFPADKKSTTVGESKYKSCEYEDYIVQSIDKVQIRQEENDIGAISGDGTNCYVVQDNFLVYGKGASELQSIADNLFYVIKSISYIPFNATLSGNLCFEVGDAVQFNTKRQIVNSYILQRKITGIQTLKDTFSAKGEHERFENVNSTNYQIVKLKGKTNTLERTVEETKSTIIDVKDNLQSQITQNAEEINLKVSKGDVSSEISQEAGKITIKGNRFILNADNIKINEDGSVEITGDLTSKGKIAIQDEVLGIVTELLSDYARIEQLTAEWNDTDGVVYVASSIGQYITFGITSNGAFYINGLIASPNASFTELHANSIQSNNLTSGSIYSTVSKTNSLTVTGSTSLASSPTITSDKRLKNDIKQLDLEKSYKFIQLLNPVRYKLNNGTSDRYHHGFIAQEVKEAMGDSDWGVYIEDENGIKGLRYEELIADLIATVQFQDKRISELERRIINE